MAKGFNESHVQAGADANLTNNVGDTPLHKAAFTGRKVCKNHVKTWIWHIELSEKC